MKEDALRMGFITWVYIQCTESVCLIGILFLSFSSLETLKFSMSGSMRLQLTKIDAVCNSVLFGGHFKSKSEIAGCKLI